MLIELHCHTSRYSSCSQLAPAKFVRTLAARGFSGVAITEHNRLWSAKELANLSWQAAISRPFLIMSGQEVETDLGHILVFGADTSIEIRTNIDMLRKHFPLAALVLAHPYREGMIPVPADLMHPALDAVEIFNANQTEQENASSFEAWKKLEFTAVAGSDSHSVHSIARFATRFTDQVSSQTQLIDAIRSGRVSPVDLGVASG